MLRTFALVLLLYPITNAIYNATGIRIMSLPVDQDSLLRAIKSGEKEVQLGWGDYINIPVLKDWSHEPISS
ncbi:MAG: hypothetical protein GKR87_16440 [Kiritimatiellae bacterium]|nr:hypothetical protein [Kiritimatiellia bacterium]